MEDLATGREPTERGRPGASVQKASRGQRSRPPTFDELGTTGLRHYGGFVFEEWLPKLSGKRGARAYREMADNDPVIGALLFAITMLARGVETRVEPGDDVKADELVETCLDDMSHTWADFIAEVFSMLIYGWDLHEIVYKRRLGPDNAVPSRYDDGLIGWRKLPTRAQETLQQWEFAEDDGGIEAMVQVAYDGVRRTVPMEKALLFRTTSARGNPEGRSILRPAHVPWFRKKNIEEIEAIGIERDLAGLPTLTAPEGVDLYAVGNEDILAQAQDLVTSVRRDEDEGIVKNHGWEFELVTTAGSRQLDTDKIIRRYDMRIATTVLADFILLAQDSVGSFALGKVKIDTFASAMQAWLTSIAEVMNRYAIPRLLRLNGMKVTEPPRIVFGDVGQIDADALATFLQGIHLAGAPIDWSHDLLTTLFKAAGLPEPEESPVGETARGGPGPYDEPTPPADTGSALPEASGKEPAPTDEELAAAT